jgi:hypothetical protein
MKFRKKPVVIEAHRWFQNGDHPKDDCYYIDDKSPDRYLSEGKLVRRFRHPNLAGTNLCELVGCRQALSRHGWIDTLEGGHRVCPGDWIIEGVEGEFYPCKNSILEKTYDHVNEDAPVE